jgi:hypothetical protein
MKFNCWWQPAYLMILSPVAAWFALDDPPSAIRAWYFVLCWAAFGAALVMAGVNLIEMRRAKRR